MASLPGQEPLVSRRLVANLFWLGKRDLRQGARYKLKLATQEVECQIVDIRRAIDASTLEDEAGPRAKVIGCNDAAELLIETRYPLALDRIQEHAATGRFVLVDGYDVAGGGIVTQILSDEGATAFDDRAGATDGAVSPHERFRHNRHRGLLVLLRGLDATAARKLAAGLERRLFERGMQTRHVVGGDYLPAEARLAAVRALAEAGLVALVCGDIGDGADLQAVSTLDVVVGDDDTTTELLHLGQPTSGALHRHLQLGGSEPDELLAAELLERILQLALTPYEVR